MTSHSRPMCVYCKHRIGVSVTCEAYPEGIPEEIFFTSEIDHREPYEGDDGIQFEPAEDVNEQDLTYIERLHQ